jgi:hypothetical protein
VSSQANATTTITNVDKALAEVNAPRRRWVRVRTV